MVRITTTVFCNACGNWLETSISNRAKVRLARRKAKEAGWATRRTPEGLRDYCPHCQAQEASAIGKELAAEHRWMPSDMWEERQRLR